MEDIIEPTKTIQTASSLAIALAILIGLALVAAAIFFSDSSRFGSLFGKTALETELTITRSGQQRLVYGDLSAATTIVEFSDFECPFCGRLHPTLMQLVDESEGQINWEYRHLPLPSHRNAETAARASECVGALAGNDAFWKYADDLFSSSQPLTENHLVSLASIAGISETKFRECLASGETKAVVELDLQVARALGGNGTPFSVIVYQDGTYKPVSGALPYEAWLPLLQNPNL